VYAQLWNGGGLAEDVRNVYLVALSAVGRSRWDQSHIRLRNAHENIFDWDSAVNCWTSVVKWAVLGGGLTVLQMRKFCDLPDGGREPAILPPSSEILRLWSLETVSGRSSRVPSHCRPRSVFCNISAVRVTRLASTRSKKSSSDSKDT
jgi:hypothetical protein